MNHNYALLENFDWRPNALLVDQALAAIIRLDERLRVHPLRDGWVARMNFHEACASVGTDGELVHLHDVVLSDAGLLPRVRTHEEGRALAVLRVRRWLPREADRWLFSAAGLGTLRERIQLNTPEAQAEAETEARGFAAWHGLVRETAGLPPVLACVIALDAWLLHPPFERDGWLGRQLVAVELRHRKVTRHHLASVSLGLRQASVAPHALARLPRERRIAELLRAIEAGAEFGTVELERMETAHRLMQRHLIGRRTTSHLPQLIDLLMRVPLVTVAMAARALGISSQAADLLMKQLAPSLNEMTERQLHRAWMIRA